jgi:hypothetical protein
MTVDCARTGSKLLRLSSKVRTFHLRRFLATYIRFRRDMITIHTEADITDELRSFDANEWKLAPLLRGAFKLTKQGKQKVDQSSRRIFPYCLRAFGPAQTCLLERMIVSNWWLNLDRVELAAKTTELAKLFEEPRVSATLRNNYDPSKPKAIGVFDIHDLGRKRAEDSHSNHMLHGGKERRNFTDAPVTNAQLRDKAIRLPEAKAQQNQEDDLSFQNYRRKFSRHLCLLRTSPDSCNLCLHTRQAR